MNALETCATTALHNERRILATICQKLPPSGGPNPGNRVTEAAGTTPPSKDVLLVQRRHFFVACWVFPSSDENALLLNSSIPFSKRNFREALTFISLGTPFAIINCLTQT